MIIAIDGPSGAGKSTLGKRIAAEYDLVYLDTGAMYRAVGLAALRAGITEDKRGTIADLTAELVIELPEEKGGRQVLLNGEDISDAIRSREVSHMASVVSTIGLVRRTLVKRQQEIGRAAKKGAVLDGRDIGTVVFPDADVKFFLTADAENRARRRHKEDLEKGRDVTFEKTLKEIILRDERDAGRQHSPLRKADDAIEIDTSELDVDQVFAEMKKAIDRNSC